PRKDIAQPREDPVRPALAALLARATLPRGLLLPAPRPNSLDVRARDGVDRFRGECYRRGGGARDFRLPEHADVDFHLPLAKRPARRNADMPLEVFVADVAER